MNIHEMRSALQRKKRQNFFQPCLELQDIEAGPDKIKLVSRQNLMRPRETNNEMRLRNAELILEKF